LLPAVLAGWLQPVTRMLVFRSLTLGLLGACLWTLLLLVTRSERHWCVAPRPPAAAAPVANPITVIDLAAQPSLERSIRDLADLVRLAPDENIVAVDDRPVVVSPACGAAPHYCDGVVLRGGRFVAGLRPVAAANDFVDFTVASATASRRVLVLIH
jgi:hypothetical protein